MATVRPTLSCADAEHVAACLRATLGAVGGHVKIGVARCSTARVSSGDGGGKLFALVNGANASRVLTRVVHALASKAVPPAKRKQLSKMKDRLSKGKGTQEAEK